MSVDYRGATRLAIVCGSRFVDIPIGGERPRLVLLAECADGDGEFVANVRDVLVGRGGGFRFAVTCFDDQLRNVLEGL